MNDILNNILMQSGLIIPLGEVEVEMLSKACSNFVNEESFSFPVFEDLVYCYLNKQGCKKLKASIENFMLMNEGIQKTYPLCVSHALVFYCIYISIEECGSHKTQAIRSLSLQNAMLQIHGKWDTLKFSDLLCSLYFKSTEYLGNLHIGEKMYPRDFARSMFKDECRVNEDIDEEMARYIQSLVLLSWDAQMQRFIDELDEKNPFMRVVYVLEHYFLNKPQLPNKDDFKKILHMTFIGKDGKKQKIGTILSMIADREVVLVDDIKSSSSQILKETDRIVSHDDGPQILLYDFRLSPKEFFVYLYHELLLEDLLKD